MFQPDEVYQGDARHIAEHIPADSEALSVWSSPYYVGKAYERDTSYIEWKAMLRRAIEAHTTVLKPDEFQHLFFFWKPGPTRIDKSRLTKDEWVAWESRAVWRIPSVCINDDHEAKFPLELPRRVIQLLTYPGELVIDCFAGSGTSGVAAVLERRRFIGVEMDERYVCMARKALRDTLNQRKQLPLALVSGHAAGNPAA